MVDMVVVTVATRGVEAGVVGVAGDGPLAGPAVGVGGVVPGPPPDLEEHLVADSAINNNIRVNMLSCMHLMIFYCTIDK